MDEDNKPHNEKNDFENLPLFKKAQEIFEVVNRICELIPDNDSHLDMIKGMMIGDAALLTAKIAGAQASGQYDLKMENTAFIRNAARNLMLQNHSLKRFGFKEVYYYEIVRTLIEEFRLLFIDWVADFDKFNYTVDRLGLFNPPGVGPFDKDVDAET